MEEAGGEVGEAGGGVRNTESCCAEVATHLGIRSVITMMIMTMT